MIKLFYTDIVARLASVALLVAALLFLWLPSVIGTFGMTAQVISVVYTLFLGIGRERAVHLTLESILWLVRSFTTFRRDRQSSN